MVNAQEPAAAPKLVAVQYLRAVAAMAVVAGHLIGLTAAVCSGGSCAFRRPNLPTGAGVDLFFLISGFIMVVASGRMFGTHGGSREFLLRRLIRIVPLYWAVTTCFVLLTSLGGGLRGPGGLAASYLFLPFDTTGRGDGFAFPIVDLGWTLNYEMLFYLLFACCIAFGRERCVAFVSVALACFITAGAAVSAPPLAVRFWTQPIMLEFASGMWLALLFVHGRLKLPAPARLALCVLASVVLLLPPLALRGPVTPNSVARVIDWGLPATAVLAAAVSGPVGLPRRVALVWRRVGDSSYSLYLTHPFWFLIVRKAGTHFPATLAPAVMMLMGMLGAIALAMAVHFLVERPVTEWLTSRTRAAGLVQGKAPLLDSAEVPSIAAESSFARP